MNLDCCCICNIPDSFTYEGASLHLAFPALTGIRPAWDVRNGIWSDAFNGIKKFAEQSNAFILDRNKYICKHLGVTVLRPDFTVGSPYPWYNDYDVIFNYQDENNYSYYRHLKASDYIIGINSGVYFFGKIAQVNGGIESTLFNFCSSQDQFNSAGGTNIRWDEDNIYLREFTPSLKYSGSFNNNICGEQIGYRTGNILYASSGSHITTINDATIYDFGSPGPSGSDIITGFQRIVESGIRENSKCFVFEDIEPKAPCSTIHPKSVLLTLSDYQPSGTLLASGCVSTLVGTYNCIFDNATLFSFDNTDYNFTYLNDHFMASVNFDSSFIQIQINETTDCNGSTKQIASHHFFTANVGSECNYIDKQIPQDSSIFFPLRAAIKANITTLY